jgi:hypothetical protein
MDITDNTEDEVYHTRKVNVRKRTCLKQISDRIINGLENVFYK